MKLHELFPEISLNPASAKDIKQWILQLAVEGKLTKKWREENPTMDSSVLLKKINIEKTELLKAKKIKKETFEPLNQDDFIAVPKKWIWQRLGEIGFIFNGDSINATVKEQRYTNIEDGFPYVSTKDVGYGFEDIDLHNGVKIPKDEPKFKIARKNTILICAEGGSAGKKMGILTEESCFGNKLFAIHEYGGILPRYILIFYGSLFFQDEFQSRMSGIIGGISRNKFAEIPICLPPLEEQQAIVTIVEDLFKEVDELEAQATQRIALKRSYAQAALQRLCEADTAKEWQQIVSVFPEIFNDKQTIKTLRETILQLAVQGKLTAKWRNTSPFGGGQGEDETNPKQGETSRFGGGQGEDETNPKQGETSPFGGGQGEDAKALLTQIKAEKAKLIKEKKIKAEKPLPPIEVDEIPFELPEGWVWCRLGDISTNRLGKMLDSNKNKGKYLPYLRNLNVQWYHFKLDDVKLMKFEDSELDEYSVKKGDLLIVEGGEPGRCAVWESDDDWFKFQKAIHRVRFLSEIQPWIYQYYFDFSAHSGHLTECFTGATIKHLTGRSLNKMLLPLPPLSEQKIIVEKVNALMGLCDELEKGVEGRNEVLSKLAV